MLWRLRLEPGLAVETQTGRLGPAPNSTVAALLVLLAARGDNLVSRTELAAALYPQSPRSESLNALRQSLFRLRGWLGDDCVQTDGSWVRLTPGRWTIVPDVLHGEKLDSVLLAGLDHPALDRLRREWSHTAPPSLDATTQAFVTVVKGLADCDPHAARGVFVAGGALLNRLGNENVAELLRRTKPTTRLDPYALEHRERAGYFYTRIAEFDQALACFVDVFRIAERLGNSAAQGRAASYIVCSSIETGDMTSAKGWLDRVDVDVRPGANLDVLNARACFDWNAGDYVRALETMALGTRHLSGVDRSSRARFWSNYSLLSAEAGQIELSKDAIAHAAEFAKDDEPEPNATLEVALALQWAQGGDPHEAIALLSRSLRRTRDDGYQVGTLYVEETLAELFASVGNAREARNLWHSAHRKRRGKDNPRTLARRRRIERLCA